VLLPVRLSTLTPLLLQLPPPPPLLPVIAALV
jgi:hypothetical protein